MGSRLGGEARLGAGVMPLINSALSFPYFQLLIVIEKRVILDDACCFVFPITILSFS